MANDDPLLWHCTKGSLIADSTAGSETFSHSTGMKDVKHVELRLKFFHVQPPKSCKVCTDSTGRKAMSCNLNKPGESETPEHSPSHDKILCQNWRR
jgi:hypothetical protein